MPNQMSPDSRRVNFICDKEFYSALEEQARNQRLSVGELIRRSLEDTYPKLKPRHAIIQMTPASGAARHGLPTHFKKNTAKKAPAKRKQKAS